MPSDPASQLQRNERITDPNLSHLLGDDLVAELMKRVEELLLVDTVSVLVVDQYGRNLVASASRGFEEEVRQGVRVAIGAGFSGRVAQLAQPLAIEDVDPETAHPLVVRRGIRALLGVPMIAGGRLMGVLTVGSKSSRAFTDVETGLLQLAGDRIASELASSERRSESWTTRVLQRSLLPSRLPTVEGLEFAERFVPGGIDLVGGDWYDTFELPSGHIGIVMGDVAGRGLNAAVVMGRLRSVLRAYAFISEGPATTLDLVDAKFAHFEPTEMATISFAVIEPTLERVRIASAGHPPPLLVEPDADARFLPVPPGPPIGTRLVQARTEAEVDLPAGATLMTYTDGLFERRHEPYDESLERLRASLRAGPVEAAVTAVMDAMIGPGGIDDDTAVLAIRRLPAG